MKTKNIIYLFVMLFFISCSRDNEISEITLHKKWKLESINIFADCEHKTTLADFTNTSNQNITCNDDDIYDFKNPKTVIINYGVMKCNTQQPNTETLPYTIDKNQINIKGKNQYNIIFLSENELIIDYCEKGNLPSPITHSVFFKVGIKLIKVDN